MAGASLARQAFLAVLALAPRLAAAQETAGSPQPVAGMGSARTAAGTVLDGTQLDLQLRRPGEWALSARYSGLQWPGDGPRLVTGANGAGGPAPRFDPGAPPHDVGLRLRRTRLGLAIETLQSSPWRLSLALSHDERHGARLSGLGMSCPSTAAPGCAPGSGVETGSAVLPLALPVDDRHLQVEARLGYAGPAWQFSAGYLGSWFHDAGRALRPGIPASLYNATGQLLPLSAGLQTQLSQPLAPAPDNEAHRLDLSGAYTFDPATRLVARLARTRAIQREAFAAVGLPGAPPGVTSLDGELIDTLAQLRLTARPWPTLSLLAEASQRDREDRTPLAAYAVVGPAGLTNRHLGSTIDRLKLQARYRFGPAWHGTLGAGHEAIDRGTFTPTAAIAGTSALRQHTRETTLQAGLQRRLADGVSGAVTLLHSERDGSHWLKDNSGPGVTEVTDPSDPASGFATAVFMPTLADRQRDELRMTADWQPAERLLVQWAAHWGEDRYRAPSRHGLRASRVRFVSLDASLAVTPAWRASAFLAYGDQQLPQSRPGGAVVAYDNRASQLGLGLTGEAGDRLQLGATLSAIDDVSRYAQALGPDANLADVELLAASGGLPAIRFRQTTLGLFARQRIDERSSVRLDLQYRHTRWTDWAFAWAGQGFAWSDGSVVSATPRQHAVLIELRYEHRWP